MLLDPDRCYRALSSRDARFDGAFFTGVTTTAIYCRTVCPARTPLRKNCEFYASAAAAEGEGYRPCLRCRPELAPGMSSVDAVGRLAATAARRIDEGALTSGDVDTLAAELGVTSRHLRRVVQTEFGVSPVELAQTQRLLLAKRLLTDTALPMTQVAFASGFQSVRRFNALFSTRYRLQPREIRRTRTVTTASLVCDLAYRPPMDWKSMLAFVGKRGIAGVEAVHDDRYFRTVAHGDSRGWIAVGHTPRSRTLRIELSLSLAPALPWTLGRVRRLFDLGADPRRIAAHLGAIGRPGLRVPGAFDGFEVAVRAILGQQITVAAATTLAGRFAGEFGEALSTPHAGLTHVWPTARHIASLRPERLCAIGVISTRARCIVALAREIQSGRVSLEPGVDVEATLARLQTIPGIGPWTADIIAMRALGWPDAFPHTDLGVRRAMGTDDPAAILATAEPWRPWRAYATLSLWKSLEKP